MEGQTATSSHLLLLPYIQHLRPTPALLSTLLSEHMDSLNSNKSKQKQDLNETMVITTKAIDRHYRFESIKLHPDRHGATYQTEFENLTSARNCLRDASLRMLYIDQMLDVVLKVGPAFAFSSHVSWVSRHRPDKVSQTHKPTTARSNNNASSTNNSKDNFFLQGGIGNDTPRMPRIATANSSKQQQQPKAIVYLQALKPSNQFYQYVQSLKIVAIHQDNIMTASTNEITLANLSKEEILSTICYNNDASNNQTTSEDMKLQVTFPHYGIWSVHWHAILDLNGIITTTPDSVEATVDLTSPKQRIAMENLTQKEQLAIGRSGQITNVLNKLRRPIPKSDLAEVEKSYDMIHISLVKARSTEHDIIGYLNVRHKPMTSSSALLKLQTAIESLHPKRAELAKLRKEVLAKNALKKFKNDIANLLEQGKAHIWMNDVTKDNLLKCGGDANRLFQLMVEGKGAAFSLQMDEKLLDVASKRTDLFSLKQIEQLIVKRAEVMEQARQEEEMAVQAAKKMETEQLERKEMERQAKQSLIGAPVVFRGLKRNELNGVVGVVVGLAKDCERFRVKCYNKNNRKDGEGEKEFSVRLENISKYYGDVNFLYGNCSQNDHQQQTLAQEQQQSQIKGDMNTKKTHYQNNTTTQKKQQRENGTTTKTRTSTANPNIKSQSSSLSNNTDSSNNNDNKAWRCVYCTFDNTDPKRAACLVCEKPRYGPPQPKVQNSYTNHTASSQATKSTPFQVSKSTTTTMTSSTQQAKTRTTSKSSVGVQQPQSAAPLIQRQPIQPKTTRKLSIKQTIIQQKPNKSQHRCKDGKNCHWLKKGVCTYHHTADEISTFTKICAKIKIDPAIVKVFIGRGGSNIKRMAKESNAKIHVDQVSMASNEKRIVEITAKSKQVVEVAISIVERFIANHYENENNNGGGGGAWDGCDAGAAAPWDGVDRFSAQQQRQQDNVVAGSDKTMLRIKDAVKVVDVKKVTNKPGVASARNNSAAFPPTSTVAPSTNQSMTTSIGKARIAKTNENGASIAPSHAAAVGTPNYNISNAVPCGSGIVPQFTKPIATTKQPNIVLKTVENGAIMPGIQRTNTFNTAPVSQSHFTNISTNAAAAVTNSKPKTTSSEINNNNKMPLMNNITGSNAVPGNVTYFPDSTATSHFLSNPFSSEMNNNDPETNKSCDNFSQTSSSITTGSQPDQQPLSSPSNNSLWEQQQQSIGGGQYNNSKQHTSIQQTSSFGVVGGHLFRSSSSPQFPTQNKGAQYLEHSNCSNYMVNVEQEQQQSPMIINFPEKTIPNKKAEPPATIITMAGVISLPADDRGDDNTDGNNDDQKGMDHNKDKKQSNLLSFLESQAACLKGSPAEFCDWLMYSEDITSIEHLAEAVSDNDYVKECLQKGNGLKGFKRGAFKKAVLNAVHINGDYATPPPPNHTDDEDDEDNNNTLNHILPRYMTNQYSVPSADFLLPSASNLSINNTPPATVPPELYCPISHELMTHDPVLAADGCTYERLSIEEWFTTRQNQIMAAEDMLNSHYGGDSVRLKNIVEMGVYSPLLGPSVKMPHLMLISNISIRTMARDILERTSNCGGIFIGTGGESNIYGITLE